MKNWHEWDQERAGRLLSRFYKFLKTTEADIFFNRELCNTVYEDKADGFNWSHAGKLKAIVFDPQPSQPFLDVVVHELTHAVYPALKEYQVAHIGTEVPKLLTDRQVTNLLKRLMGKIK